MGIALQCAWGSVSFSNGKSTSHSVYPPVNFILFILSIPSSDSGWWFCPRPSNKWKVGGQNCCGASRKCLVSEGTAHWTEECCRCGKDRNPWVGGRRGILMDLTNSMGSQQRPWRRGRILMKEGRTGVVEENRQTAGMQIDGHCFSWSWGGGVVRKLERKVG